nr:D-aminoacyl-tRNA deacylase-like [Ipomoea batatas]
MVTLVVATTTDPASNGPATALLSMPGWTPGPNLDGVVRTFVCGHLRLLQHDKGIVEEDDLDLRWEKATTEPVDEVIFLSKHTAVSNRPALTIHPIGVPHLKEGDVPPQGGRPGWAAPPNPRMGSTEEYWKRQDAARVVALLIWEGHGLGEGSAIGTWDSCRTPKNKVLLGLGGGHYVPRHMDIIQKDGCWVGHLLSGYALPMEDPGQSKVKAEDIGGTWRQAIKAAFDATREAFPGGEILAHLDQKSFCVNRIRLCYTNDGASFPSGSFKGWQKNAITEYLASQNIKVGKPSDFC